MLGTDDGTGSKDFDNEHSIEWDYVHDDELLSVQAAVFQVEV